MDPDKRVRIAKYVVLALIIGGAVVAAPRVRHWYLVDDCLDRSGAWDYVNDKCDLPNAAK